VVRVTLKYVVEDVDRHGNIRFYFRRKGFDKIRLRGLPGSEQFRVAYAEALAKTDSGEAPRKTADPERGSVAWLCLRYYQSSGFLRLDHRTRHVRRLILDGFCMRGAGCLPYKAMTTQNILGWRDAMHDRPEAANSLIKALRQLFAYGIAYKDAEKNPAKDAPFLKGNPNGIHSWTDEEIAQFEAYHPVGSTARLALTLLLNTGQRRSDVVRFGQQHLKACDVVLPGGLNITSRLHFTQYKKRKNNPVTLAIPVLPDLEDTLAATPVGSSTFLVTELGKPFTSNGFGNRFRKWCGEAGLPRHCSAHGLRKAAARRFAEAGCSENEIAAWTGHRSLKEVSRYTRAARQQTLADNAAARLIGNKSVPLSSIQIVPPENSQGVSDGKDDDGAQGRNRTTDAAIFIRQLYLRQHVSDFSLEPFF
jgi:site-specific recombinase XerD